MTKKVKLPYLTSTRGKAGAAYYYYRRGGQWVPIKSADGSFPPPHDPAFMAAYTRIHQSFEHAPDSHRGAAGTMAALIEHFLDSPEYKQLSDPSRYEYRRYLDQIKRAMGSKPVATMPPERVLAFRDRYQDRPRTANYVVSVLRRLMAFALQRGYRPDQVNPAAGIKPLKTSGRGHRAWEEGEIKKFRDHWPKESLQRVAFELLLNTGQRGGDVAAMTRGQYDGQVIRLTQRKTGERLIIPASETLTAVLDPWLATHKNLVILTTRKGTGLNIYYFRHMLRDAFDDAGLPKDCDAHGLRYTAATVLKELGCDWEDIGAITGHATVEMVRKYTKKKRRATVAIARLNRAEKNRNRT